MKYIPIFVMGKLFSKCCRSRNKSNSECISDNIRDITMALPVVLNNTNLITWISENFSKVSNTNLINDINIVMNRLNDENIKIKEVFYKYSTLNDTMYYYIRIYNKNTHNYSVLALYLPSD